MEQKTIFFLPLPPQHLQKLESIPISAQCSMHRLIENQQKQSINLIREDNLDKHSKCCIQIRGRYILQCHPQTYSILSYLQVSLYLKIEIIKQGFTHQLLTTSFQKKSIVKIMLTHPLHLTITLLPLEQLPFIALISHLQTFPLVQLGFDKKNHYEPLRRVGKGSHAVVYESFDHMSQTKVAIRCFRLYKVCKNRIYLKSFLEEVELLYELSNKPFFSHLHAIYESQNSLYMVMELLSRNLLAHIQKFGFPTIKNCKLLMLNLSRALSHLHQRDIMHRDIKLANIMMREDALQTSAAVIVDFGIARKGAVPAHMPVCGTPGFIAPEIFASQGYTCKCDVFSLGIVYHFLLLGHLVFEGNSSREIATMNRNCEIDYEFSRHPTITPEIKSLLAGMLARDPKQRLSAQEVSEHPFFQDRQ